MRLKNTTDIPSETIRKLIRVLRPPGVVGFDVRVCNTRRSGRGRAYYAGSSFHDRACPFIVVGVPRTEAMACTRCRAGRNGRGYLEEVMGSRMEVLVVVLAHELRHLWQARVPRSRRVYGARGQLSERDADAYALSALRTYRRGELGHENRRNRGAP